MSGQDIRWQQRFISYKKALIQLEEAVTLYRQRALSRLEKQGMIQAFEFTHELAWNVFKDFFQNQGDYTIKGSKDAIRAAFKAELIQEGERWMETIQARNNSSHTYDEHTAERLVIQIVEQYFPLFETLQIDMEKYCV